MSASQNGRVDTVFVCAFGVLTVVHSGYQLCLLTACTAVSRFTQGPSFCNTRLLPPPPGARSARLSANCSVDDLADCLGRTAAAMRLECPAADARLPLPLAAGLLSGGAHELLFEVRDDSCMRHHSCCPCRLPTAWRAAELKHAAGTAD